MVLYKPPPPFRLQTLWAVFVLHIPGVLNIIVLYNGVEGGSQCSPAVSITILHQGQQDVQPRGKILCIFKLRYSIG